uniref:Transmembrane protein n=1 Tax=Noccaea caerulescens TaxID=107243 RepID=A0A1J3JPZ2_NOCCA
MREAPASGLSWRLMLFFASISLQFVLGLSGDTKNTNTGVKAESHTSSSKTGTKVILILLGFVTVAMFSFFLYKLWQKKKRDEQYARLLKLFEEDDELEVELGLRD